MKRLAVFAKGNVDVRDSLHSCRIGNELVWNGINEVLRVSHPGCVARVKHETWTRSDMLLQATGVIPESVSSRQLPLGPYPPASQFSRAVIDAKSDVIVLSAQPDIATTSIKRHKGEGFLFYPAENKSWGEADKQWLKTEFESVGSLDVSASMANFTAIIAEIRSKSEAPILIYNMSPVTPGEAIHCYQGMDDSYSTRIRKFNVGLIELSEQTGVSLIDVDLLLARKGTDELKLDTLHLKPAAYRIIAEEVVRVLDDLGVLDEEGA